MDVERLLILGENIFRGIIGREEFDLKKTRRKISLSSMGNKNGKGNKGFKHSEESKLKMSLTQLAKPHPEDEYCNEWRDKEYKKDLRKDYCENVDCKGNYKLLINHHIDLNKKNCHPSNIMTLCVSCSSTLHCKLQIGKRRIVNYKDYLTIIRKDHITYVYKKTRKIIATIRRKERILK